MNTILSNPDAFIGAVLMMAIPLLVIMIVLLLISDNNQAPQRNASIQDILKNGVL